MVFQIYEMSYIYKQVISGITAQPPKSGKRQEC